MLHEQALMLQEIAADLILKARAMVKASDVQTFTELALRCLSEAREITVQVGMNSVALYVTCCVGAEKQPDYDHFLEFCARNGYNSVTDSDFASALAGLGLTAKKAPDNGDRDTK